MVVHQTSLKKTEYLLSILNMVVSCQGIYPFNLIALIYKFILSKLNFSNYFTLSEVFMNQKLIFFIGFLVLSFSLSSHIQAQINDNGNPAFIDVKKTKITISQSTFGDVFREATLEYKLPIKDEIMELIESIGIVNNQDDFDIVIKIEAEVFPKGSNYVGQIYGIHYSGASIEGFIIFESKTGIRISKPFHSYLYPPKEISTRYPTVSAAPFEKVFYNGNFHRIFFLCAYEAFGIKPIISALSSNNSNTQLAARKALNQINQNWYNPSDINKNTTDLINALNDTNWFVRKSAAEVIGIRMDSLATIHLLNRLKVEDNYNVKEAISKSLYKINEDWFDPKDEETLDKLLHFKEPQPVVRSSGRRYYNTDINDSVNYYLKNINCYWYNSKSAKNKVPELITFIKNENNIKCLRKAIIEILGKIKDTKATVHLIGLLHDFDLATPAAEALGNVRDTNAITPLIEALYTSRANVGIALNNIDPNWRYSEEAKNRVDGFLNMLKHKERNYGDSKRYSAAMARV